MAKILIADDDQTLALGLRQWLETEHHTVDMVGDGKEVTNMLAAFEYDLLILDWEMPGMSGPEIVRRFRKNGGKTPILMLTGHDDLEDKEFGLDAGADDYLTKPFQIRELSARVRALLRRASLHSISGTLKVRDFQLDPQSRTVTKSGQLLKMQPLEFSVLEFFMRHPGEVFSADQLIARVWSSDNAVSVDAIYTCINRLRKKLDVAGTPTVIENLHGVGYKLIP